MEALRPIEIARQGTEGIRISWNDGSKHALASRLLRLNCPCATCREKRGDQSHSTPLAPAKAARPKSLLKVVEHSAKEESSVEAIWPIGNYALGIRWGDGHDSGIYTFTLLQQLAQQPALGEASLR